MGTNDRPTLTLTPTSDTVVSDPGYDKDHTEVAKDLTVTGTFEGADPDSNPTLEFGVSTSAGNRDTAFGADGNNPGMGGGHHSATGTYGSLTIDPSSGEYTYTLDTAKGGAADKLGLNADGTPQTGTDTFTIYVRDEHGAWSEQTVTITVNGSNDAPVIAKTENTLTVTESGFKADNTAVDTTHDVSKGSVGATDVDTSDQGKLTYYFSDKAHNPVTFGKGDVIGPSDARRRYEDRDHGYLRQAGRNHRNRLRHVPSGHQDRRVHVHEGRIHRQRHRSAPARRQGGTRLLHQREGFPRRNGFEHA